MLPKQYTETLKSYITGRVVYVKHDEVFSTIKDNKPSVPQGSVLGPVRYLFTRDIPQTERVAIVTYVNDTAILAVEHDIKKNIEQLHQAPKSVTK